jgi:hypothetical protein
MHACHVDYHDSNVSSKTTIINSMEYRELTRSLLISAQRALLGAIYPEIRAIAVGFDGSKELTIKMYLDRMPNEMDYEELSDISAQILGDVEFTKVEELCEYHEGKISLGNLDFFVYMRKEPTN